MTTLPINMLSIIFAGDQILRINNRTLQLLERPYQQLALQIAFCLVSMERELNKRKLKHKQELQNTDKLL